MGNDDAVFWAFRELLEECSPKVGWDILDYEDWKSLRFYSAGMASSTPRAYRVMVK